MRANSSVQAFIYSLKVYLLNSYSAPEIMRTNTCKIKYLTSKKITVSGKIYK